MMKRVCGSVELSNGVSSCEWMTWWMMVILMIMVFPNLVLEGWAMTALFQVWWNQMLNQMLKGRSLKEQLVVYCFTKMIGLLSDLINVLGIEALYVVPKQRWCNPFAYPEKWMILSCVMIVTWFLVVYLRFQDQSSNQFRLAIQKALLWFLFKCRPPDPLATDHQAGWGSYTDPEEMASLIGYKYLHVIHYADAYMQEHGNDLNHVWNVIDMNIRCGSPTNICDSTSKICHNHVGLSNQVHQHVIDMRYNDEKNSETPHPIRYDVPLKCASSDQNNMSQSTLIVDTGASVSFTFDESDFVGKIEEMPQQSAKGFVGEATIEGCGIVEWTVVDDKGITQCIQTVAVLVKNGERKLLSPQSYFQFQDSMDGYVKVTKDSVLFHSGRGWTMTRNLSARDNMPEADLVCFRDANGDPVKNYNAIFADMNLNLTAAQKELLLWHQRLGHVGFHTVQNLMKPDPDTNASPCLVPRVPIVASCKAPKCEACLYARMTRRQAKGQRARNECEMAIRANDLFPGAGVSCDQYESSVKGRLPNTKGKEASHRRYVGGTIYVDHASGFVMTYHQSSLGAADTLKSKHAFERELRLYGHSVRKYHTDNGIFKSGDLRQDIELNGQMLTFSGVGAHHQNGVAERAIQTIMERARAMMLHAAIHWPKASRTELWPMAVAYSTFLWNHTPRSDSGLAPVEILSGSKMDYGTIQSARVWGCPTYVLDPKLQDGHKLPKWKPRSRRGQFMGMSSEHASTIGLIRNLQTGSLSPQYHVVYDELFETVARDDDKVSVHLWYELVSTQRIYYPDEDDVPPALADEWLDEMERRQKDHANQHRHRAAVPIPFLSPDPNPRRERFTKDLADGEADGNDAEALTGSEGDSNVGTEEDHDAEVLRQAEEAMETGRDTMGDVLLEPEGEHEPPVRRNPDRACKKHSKYNVNHLTSRARTLEKGDHFLLFQMSDDELHMQHKSSMNQILQYMTQISETVPGVFEYHHPAAFQAKVNDADVPTWEQAMSSEDSEGFWEAMDKELAELSDKEAWDVVDRNEAKKAGKRIFGSTWAFRRKRFPDGKLKKLKARICVRGDQQVLGVDVFDTYAPVVQWSTVRLLLILSVALGLVTVQVDYENAFVQAVLPEPVYIEMPRGYRQEGKIFKLYRNVYGLREAPLNFYNKLVNGLTKEGFSVSQRDQCLFLNKSKSMVCVSWVDDCLFFALDDEQIQSVIVGLRKNDFILDRESDVAGFLGIDLRRKEDGTIELLQIGLIDRIVNAMGLQDANGKDTPAEVKPLVRDEGGDLRTEDWNYASVVGMLLYLSNNSRPDLTYAVNQCARYSRDPRKSHEQALKRIGRYLIQTKEKGLIVKPSGTLKLECFADADYAGLWSYVDSTDPVSVRSRTGYLMTLGEVPVIWTSKLQTEIALSTMESEYIALSAAMKELIPLRDTLIEIEDVFKIGNGLSAKETTVWEDNAACLVLANSPPPRMTPRSKHIAVKYHWFRSHLTDKLIKVRKIDSCWQKADILTKGMGKVKFQEIRKLVMGW